MGGLCVVLWVADGRSAEPAITLPKFVVSDSLVLPQPEAWRYAAVPGFEILSNASDRTTVRLVEDFELFTRALGLIWPQQEERTAPMRLILCGQGGRFDAFKPTTQMKFRGARVSYFLSGASQRVIVIDLESRVLNVAALEQPTPIPGSSPGAMVVNHNKQLYREYVHGLLAASEVRLPAWFAEGLAQIVMGMKVDRNEIEFGQLEDPNAVSAENGLVAEINAGAARLAALTGSDAVLLPDAPVEDDDFNRALRRRRLLPMESFLTATADSAEAQTVLGDNLWAKQACALVHMCLYGQNGRLQKPLAEYLNRVAAEPASETVFRACFKMGYGEMQSLLSDYITFTAYTSHRYRIKGDGLRALPPPTMRDATPAEVGRIKGEAQWFAGHREAARLELIAPYVRGEFDPPLLAALGLHERGLGQDERARRLIEAAVAGKVIRPDAYLELARLRFAAATVTAGEKKERLSPAQLSSVLEPLHVARKQRPLLPAVYELMADAWARAAATPRYEDMVPLVQGVQLFPREMRLTYLTAMLCREAGMVEPAQSLAEHGLRSAPNAATKARFEAILALLPPAKPAAAGRTGGK